MTIVGSNWGFIEEGAFFPVPYEPLKQAGMHGPTPFTVKLPDGRLREIVSAPEQTTTACVEAVVTV